MLPDLHERLQMQLLSLGYEAIRQIYEVTDEPVSATITGLGLVLTMTLARAAASAHTHAPPADLRPFLLTPLEERVVQFITESGGAKAAVIGNKLDMVDGDDQPSTTLRLLLAGLVKRKILVNGDSGYTLTEQFVKAS